MLRCWHGQAVTRSGELLIHSGLTQEYYLNRIQLDSHAEEMLDFQFGPRTLLRSALEFILQHSSLFRPEEHLGALPRNLQSILRIRTEGQHFAEEIPPKEEEDPFDREVIHAGI